LASPWLTLAQNNDVLTIVPPARLSVKRGAPVEVKLQCKLRDGYHTNSHTPSDPYLVPLKLTWDASLLTPAGVTYPKPVMEKYDFNPQPLSVFTGAFEIVSSFSTPAGLPSGPNLLTGKLRYQACTKAMCLPPKTMQVQVPLVVQ